MNKIISIILIIGVIYRLLLTHDGNFLFNMDNGRDFVDVREMVELRKLRLTGPTSAIEGLYNGPIWYYLLAVPYIISGGNPYSAILMEIVLWVIGGFFLLKLVKDFNKWLILPIGLIWVASDYIVLTNRYSFNPNPVTLLTPVFIYGLMQYLKGKKFWIILTWFLAGAFFNFEMNFGIFIPVIIFIGLLFINKKLFKDKLFWIGFIVFILTLLPQLFFDLKHQFIMSKSVLRFLSEGKGGVFNPLGRFAIIGDKFFNTFEATLMNHKVLSKIIILLSLPIFIKYLTSGKKNIIVLISLTYVIIPFLGYLLIPVAVNPWHLGGAMAASLILIGFLFSGLWRINFLGKLFSVCLSIVLIFYALSNILDYFIKDRFQPNMDPSLYKNEIAAIDFVYKYAKGQNFKVYTYLPSVYDYPYQYLIWWYGRKNYGYVPGEYVYSPNKPIYIPGQEKFQGTKSNFSNLVFLIKEPDRNYTRAGWEGAFIKLESIEKKMVGSIEIEVRRE